MKHIHHHKKIYITNHAAPSQYAPAFMPSADSTIAVPSTLPGNILPLNPIDLYDESRPPRLSAAGSKLLPLYRARGYYGPQPVDSEDQEYDLSPPPEPTDNNYVPAFADSSVVPASNFPPKNVKILKINEASRKKPGRKPKPKPRVIPRGKPQPPIEEELPVTSYHEQFYSDLDGSGTIRKIRKPPRVEKIIDGDTEHIHTYSEEHIHKLMYDDGRVKLSAVNPIIGSMSAISGAHPFINLKNAQMLAIPPEALAGIGGTFGTPAHLEYSAYNPREVTHDHIFHDHGEIPSGVDVTKEPLPFPPKLSYTSHGIPIATGPKGYKQHKSGQRFKQDRPISPTDYSYYENIYTPYKSQKAQKPTHPTYFGELTDTTLDDYKLLPSYKQKENLNNIKSRDVTPGLYFGSRKPVQKPTPFGSVSSTVVHDYKPKNFAGQSSRLHDLNKFKDPLLNFKDNSYLNNFDYEPYSSSQNLYTSEDKTDNSPFIYQGRGKKKSVSTQNINFGGKDLQTTVDHLRDSSLSLSDMPSAFDSATSTPYTIRESSPAHSYYSAMAAQALHSDHLSEASSDNFQYAEPPMPSTTTPVPVATTTASALEQQGDIGAESTEITEIDSVPTEKTQPVTEKKRRLRSKGGRLIAKNTHKDTRQRHSVFDLPSKDYKSPDRPVAPTLTVLQNGPKHSYNQHTDSSILAASVKYGDRI